ncbi:MAG TPA: UDP-glucuronic acid decarboxylase family protein [Terriglobia bacterium]|nr:UDP-glucuronic acid decarboxylase family protein [Terriglobia bacterium]
MRVVITGGAGFLGSHLCEQLLAAGHQVCCVDSLITGRLENIATFENRPEFKFLRHDVTKPIKVEGAVDAVMHFASPASPIDYLRLPIQTLKVGSLGTHNALGLAKARGARFLLASTSEVYGDPEISPQVEDYWGHVNPVGPRGVYDEAKRFAEALTLAYHRYHGLDTRIARIFNTYGPRMRPNDGRVISNFIVQALQGKDITIYGEGTQTRSFCYVSDLVEGIIRLLFHNGRKEEISPAPPQAIHQPVNLGNPTELNMVETATLIIRLTSSSSRMVHCPLPVDDPKCRRPDISRARDLLGWEPCVSLEEGLSRTIDYFRGL